MDERTLEYGTNSREDLYKLLYAVLNNHMPFADVPGYSGATSEERRGLRASFEHLSGVVIQMAFMSSTGGGQVNPVHRPVVEQLMTDLQAMLDKMPVEEKLKPTLKEDILRRQSEALARKLWVCPVHGRRPWQSQSRVLHGWCHKPLADGTECGEQLVEKPKPEGMFHNA